MGSTRAPASPDPRPAGRNGAPIRSLNGDSFERARAVGEGADRRTRGFVRSPSRLNAFGLAVLAWLILLSSSSRLAADFQGATHMTPFDEDTIGYSKTPTSGAIARLEQRLAKGGVTLKFDPTFGYLPSLLEALHISPSSQMLVFSKTSFQRERISPEHPRALYFNDDVYIGYVAGSPLLEISEADPKLGGVFYTLDQKAGPKPKLTRTDQCLECHASAKSMGVPGHLIRSFATDETGVVDLKSGTSLVNHRTPLAERWGGWYVSGTHGNQIHRGNIFGQAALEQQEREPNFLGNLTNLSRFFRVETYLSPHSDLVALLVLEHQSHLHNFITRLNYETTLALSQYGHINYLKGMAEAFLKYLLFSEEAPLTSPIRGASDYAATFSRQGPQDRQGRSLREFDLQTRLFKFPCSYLIYSDAFDHLPGAMKAHLYRRLWEILSGQDTSPAFTGISGEAKRAILSILIDTKPDLPDYWRAKS